MRADFDPATGEGGLLPEIRAAADSFPVTVQVPELGVERVFDTQADVGPVPVGVVEPWSADVPRLYEVRVGNGAEERTFRTGFRRVEIVGHEWRVNGTKLRLRGVNRHEYDPDQGRVFNREKAREGLLLMKQHNVNCIRTVRWCCLAVSLICLPASVVFGLLIFMVVIMGFLSMMVNVVCQVMKAAVVMREESDLTI